MLRITVHNTPSALTFQLEGMVAGPWVIELEKSFRSALVDQPVPNLCVDLTAVTFIDETGKTFLAALHKRGARFLAADCATVAIVEEITQSTERDEENPR